VAPLGGVESPTASGRLEGAPGDEWTARHVAGGAGRTVRQLLDDWDANASAVEAAIEGGMLPFAMDVAVHEQDLRGALGIEGPGDLAVVKTCVGLVVKGIGIKLDQAGVAALTIEAGEQSLQAGRSDPGATVRAPTLELFRAFFGRRSERQIRAYDWTGSPDPYLPYLNILGTVPTEDVVEPE
jgi:hypothetical protein